MTMLHLSDLCDKRWGEPRTALDNLDLPRILEQIPMTRVRLVFDTTHRTTPAFMRGLRRDRPDLQAVGMNAWCQGLWDQAGRDLEARHSGEPDPEPLGCCAVHGNYWTEDCEKCVGTWA